MPARLRALRDILGLTIDTVAARAGIPPERVRRVEAQDDASGEDAARVLTAYGLDPAVAADDAIAPDEDHAPGGLFFFKGESTVVEADDLAPLSEGLRWARVWAASAAGADSQARRRAVHPVGVRGERPAPAARQGHALAQWVRRRLGRPAEPIASAREVAEDVFGVPVTAADLRSPGLRAAALVARARSAAAIVIRAPRPDEGSRVRVDIAHELCHVLFDALDPGRANLALDHDEHRAGGDLTEPRARGFAAELLVPLAGLSALFGAPDRLGDRAGGIERVRRCCEHFAAPPKLVTHHLYNHGYLSKVTHDRLVPRHAEIFAALPTVDIETPDAGAPPICVARAADETWRVEHDAVALSDAAEEAWRHARRAAVAATIDEASALDAAGDGARAGLVLSRLGDAALRAGDQPLLVELFGAVDAATLSERPIRALLTNTRAADLTIPARQRLVEQVCEARRARGRDEGSVEALRARLA